MRRSVAISVRFDLPNNQGEREWSGGDGKAGESGSVAGMGTEETSQEPGARSEVQPPGTGRRTMELRRREQVECLPGCEGWDGGWASKRA